MARKWSNRNLPGALHFVTCNLEDRLRIFSGEAACQAFTDVLAEQRVKWPFKVVAYVLMPDHFHLIVNPRDGRIRRQEAGDRRQGLEWGDAEKQEGIETMTMPKRDRLSQQEAKTKLVLSNKSQVAKGLLPPLWHLNVNIKSFNSKRG